MTPLLAPSEPLLLIVDQEPGLAFGVGSDNRQLLVGNTVALVKTARLFQSSGRRIDTCGGITTESHALALRRMEAATRQ